MPPPTRPGGGARFRGRIILKVTRASRIIQYCAVLQAQSAENMALVFVQFRCIGCRFGIYVLGVNEINLISTYLDPPSGYQTLLGLCSPVHLLLVNLGEKILRIIKLILAPFARSCSSRLFFPRLAIIQATFLVPLSVCNGTGVQECCQQCKSVGLEILSRYYGKLCV